MRRTAGDNNNDRAAVDAVPVDAVPAVVVPEESQVHGDCGWCGRGPHVRGQCDRRGGRARKGWIRAAILALLAERAMHGYEMISELKARTGGLWAPSPGSVYPALQLLTEEELIEIEEGSDGGRRRYALTEAGRRLAESRRAVPAPWASMARPVDPVDAGLKEASGHVDAALAQVIAAGSGEQKARARDVLVEARRALYRILADDL